MTKSLSRLYHSTGFKIFQIIALITICGFSIHRWRPNLIEAWPIMKSIPIWSILLLFGSQLILYFCNAELFQLPLTHRQPIGKLWRTAVELNFINTAIVWGEGLGFFWIQRLGKSSLARRELRCVFVLRYFVSILTNNFLSLLAMLWLRSRVDIDPKIYTTVLLVNGAFVVGFAVATAIALIWVHRPPKGTVLPLLLWGLVYSLIEDIPYWIIAASLGHPELFPAILVGTAAGDIIGEISPLPASLGLHEIPMIAALHVLGADLSLATAITLSGRTWTLMLMLPIGFVLALLSALSEGHKSIRAALDHQTIETTSEASSG